MAGFKPTKDQVKAVESRGKSVLVSAAAGSGKTTILVDRIIKKILDDNNPIDIDKFLVVTFTKAAASNMKDKIIKAINKKLEEDPLNSHLSKQLALVNYAEIETIDSFCLRVVKENVSFLDFDSNFSLGSDDSVKILAEDVAKELFEEKFESGNKDFKFLMDVFSKKGSVDELKEFVFDIVSKANAFPYPVDWLKEALEFYCFDEDTGINEVPLVKYFFAKSIKLAEESLELIDPMAAAIVEKYDVAIKESILEEDRENLEYIAASSSYTELYERLNSTKFKNVSYVNASDETKKAELDEFQRKKLRGLRDVYKGIASSKGKQAFAAPEKIIEDIENVSKYLRPLLELSIEFYERFQEAKKQELMFTFTDIERFACELLVDGTADGKVVPSKLAKAMSRRYEEIYIDEYQDSNYLQEYILSSVAGAGREASNMFMVGDVKQSIYRFRKAKPELFIGKYNTFLSIENDEQGTEQRILLSENFRSRKEVLDGINYIFGQIMGEDFGEIAYDEDAKLNAGKSYPEIGETDRIDPRTEVIYIDSANSDDDSLDEKSIEARAIADRILEYTHPETGLSVYDEDMGEYRRAEFRDIKILLRSPDYLSKEIADEFASRNIPVYVDDSDGYFSTTEISIMLALIAIVDNSYQDVPFYSALVSPIGKVVEDEVVRVCKAFDEFTEKRVRDDNPEASETELIKLTKKAIRTTSLYEKCKLYIKGYDDELSLKLDTFLTRVKEYKIKKQYVSVADLLRYIYDDTGYYLYASAMPLGDRRRANLDSLVKRAADYENGSYKGLFDYVRYIEKTKATNSDFDEASIVSEDSNVVQVMSMHKSKGLEFTICFVAGLGKQYNLSDSKGTIVVDDDYYIVGKTADYVKKYFGQGFLKQTVAERTKDLTKAEELRDLYVAFTRAKEKLILTGKIDKLSLDESYAYVDRDSRVLLPGVVRTSVIKPIEFLYLALKRKNLRVFDCEQSALFVETDYRLGESVVCEVESKNTISKEFEAVVQLAIESKDDNQVAFFEYPASILTEVESKLSISQLKHEAAEEKGIHLEGDYDKSDAMSQSEDEYDKITLDGIVKKFKERNYKRNTEAVEEEFSGTDYGSFMHKYCELIPFAELDYTNTEVDWYSYATELRDKLVARAAFNADEAKILSIKALSAFLGSDLCRRMSEAAKKGDLHIEEMFYIGLDPVDTRNKLFSKDEVSKYRALITDDDLIVVQGIIDAYFYEDGELVLMDYKTDVVEVSEIVDRYQRQIDLYKESLERIKQVKVKECILYSFKHQVEISI